MSESRPTLLVADDERTIRKLVSELFIEDFDVLEATNGIEAIQMALKYRPDCILLDVMMPEMGGYVVLEVLKQVRATQLIPILILSGKSPENQRRLALESGAVDFIHKPFDGPELVDCVQRIIHNQPRERRMIPRLVVAVPVRVEGETESGAFRIHTLTEDISRKGLRFYGELAVKPGDRVRIYTLQKAVGLPPAYAGEARIVWVDETFQPLLRCGAEFTEVSPQWIVQL